MKYMLLHCINSDVDISPEAAAEMHRSMMAWLEDAIPRGVSLHGGKLQPPTTAATVRVRDGALLVTDGPFAETKEQVAGYDVIECADLDEALEVVSRLPLGYGCIEVRPFRTAGEAMPRRELGVVAWAEEIGRRHQAGEPDQAPPATTPPKRQETAANKFMMLVCVPEDWEQSSEEAAEAERQMLPWLDDTINSGVSLHGGRLLPVSTATTVRAGKGELLVTDGPFAETKEHIAGYDVIECADRDQAIEIASRHPVAGFGCIEVRQFEDSEQGMPRRRLEVAEWAQAMTRGGVAQRS